MDSFNLLVPQKCNGKNSDGVSVDQQYNDTQWGQPCSVFAIHGEMSLLKELYDAGDLIFFANTGVLAEANSTKNNYRQKNRMNLSAHNTMQKEASTADPLKEVAGTGVLGRLGTVLKRNGHSVNSSPLNIGRGRVLPTTSWDAIWNGVSEWMGVDSSEDKDYCLPGRKKSTGRGFTELIPEDRLFITSRRKNRNLRST